jgi:hypothetical protein
MIQNNPSTLHSIGLYCVDETIVGISELGFPTDGVVGVLLDTDGVDSVSFDCVVD